MAIADKLAKRTRLRNARFDAATKAEKRVMIAKDALKLLDTRKVIAERGTYVSTDPRLGRLVEELGTQRALKKIETEEVECKVCGIGVLLLSQTRFDDQFELTKGEWGSGFGAEEYYASRDEAPDEGKTMGQRLEDHFSHDQLRTIERAFERYDRREPPYYYQDDEDHPDYVSFSSSYLGEQPPSGHEADETVLRAILQNIIRNKGTFKISDRKGAI